MNTLITLIRGALGIGIALATLTACDGGGGGGLPLGPEDVGSANIWVIDPSNIFDGGPGKDGIPALANPTFGPIAENEPLDPQSLVVALKVGDRIKVYPHDIMDYHEIVNDELQTDPIVLSYCPLTGSALAWKGNPEHADPTFGVSGLLYNSNLLPYDRETNSLWSQMLEVSINGDRILERPDRIQAVETSWGTISAMYPDAIQMTRDTGYSRDYDDYPYGSFKVDANLLFPVTNVDNRLHPKTRVIGVRANSALSKVYQIGAFGDSTQAINDQFNDQSIVVIGNTSENFAVIYSRELGDGTILNFSPVNGGLPNIMMDDEGNVWDIFGAATSGPRVGTQLSMTSSYTAYWFAWAAHFVDAEIYFN